MRFFGVPLWILLVVSVFVPSHIVAAGYQYPKGPIGLACDSFLPSLFNPNPGLLAETPGSSSYYVASDNLLVLKAFDLACYETPSLADWIRSAISLNSCCKQANDSMHESVAGLPISLPIHAANLYNVNSTWRPFSCCYHLGTYTVYYENHNGTGILSDAQYGDVAAYTTLELEREGNHSVALHEISLLRWMYDGRGIVDDAYKYGTPGERGVYQTLKDALYMLALAKTGQWIPPDLEKTVLSMQGIDGGFHTGYDNNGNYTGSKENVETTAIAVIALHSLPANIQIETNPYHNITGTGPFRTVKVVPFFSNIGNWTVAVNVTVYWDNTTNIVGNQTGLVLHPLGQGGVGLGAVFSHNVTFDATLPHFLRIYAGNSSLTLSVYSPPPPPQESPWWITYWYVLLVPSVAAIILVVTYKRRILQRHRPVTISSHNR